MSNILHNLARTPRTVLSISLASTTGLRCNTCNHLLMDRGQGRGVEQGVDLSIVIDPAPQTRRASTRQSAVHAAVVGMHEGHGCLAAGLGIMNTSPVSGITADALRLASANACKRKSHTRVSPKCMHAALPEVNLHESQHEVRRA